MPIDPAGTTPGLVNEPPVEDRVNMKCKNCDSIVAIRVQIPGLSAHHRMYRCVKCHRSWGASVGGGIDL